MQFSRSGVVIGGYCAAYGFTADVDDVFMIPDGDWSTGLRHLAAKVTVEVLRQHDQGHYEPVRKITTALGHSTGVFVPAFSRLSVAVPQSWLAAPRSTQKS